MKLVFFENPLFAALAIVGALSSSNIRSCSLEGSQLDTKPKILWTRLVSQGLACACRAQTSLGAGAPRLAQLALATDPPGGNSSSRFRKPQFATRQRKSYSFRQPDDFPFSLLGKAINSIPFVRFCRRSSASLPFSLRDFRKTGPWRFFPGALCYPLLLGFRCVTPRNPRLSNFGEAELLPAALHLLRLLLLHCQPPPPPPPPPRPLSYYLQLTTSSSSDPSTLPRLRDNPLPHIRITYCRFESDCDSNTSRHLRKESLSRMMAAEPTPQGSVEDTATPVVLRVSNSLPRISLTAGNCLSPSLPSDLRKIHRQMQTMALPTMRQTPMRIPATPPAPMSTVIRPPLL